MLDIYVHESCQRTGIGKVVELLFRKCFKSFWKWKIKCQRSWHMTDHRPNSSASSKNIIICVAISLKITTMSSSTGSSRLQTNSTSRRRNTNLKRNTNLRRNISKKNLRLLSTCRTATPNPDLKTFYKGWQWIQNTSNLKTLWTSWQNRWTIWVSSRKDPSRHQKININLVLDVLGLSRKK